MEAASGSVAPNSCKQGASAILDVVREEIERRFGDLIEKHEIIALFTRRLHD